MSMNLQVPFKHMPRIDVKFLAVRLKYNHRKKTLFDSQSKCLWKWMCREGDRVSRERGRIQRTNHHEVPLIYL